MDEQLLGGEWFSDSELGGIVIHFCILIMAEKSPSGFVIEQRAKSDGEEEKDPPGRRWRTDPTYPGFQIACQQKEEIAAFLQRFRKVP